jgi:hypothetical protein
MFRDAREQCWRRLDSRVNAAVVEVREVKRYGRFMVRPLLAMPVRKPLDPPYFEQRLDPAEQDAEALAWMLRPYRAEAMRAYLASPLVNSPKNDDLRCLEPAT